MTSKDHYGLAVTGASPAAVEAFHAAQDCFNRYSGDAMTSLEAAIADSPGFTLAHLLKAYMTLVGADTETRAMGLAAFETARGLPANDREAGHVAALNALISGQIATAARILEDIAIDHPYDSLALHGGQLFDFLLGDSRMLRDRIARAAPHWTRDMPDWHAIQGMLAFGFEECGQYVQAEAAGRDAIDAEPRNNWAQHAVAHVLLMQGRNGEGVRWMRHDNTAWQPEAMLGVHNWWHTALFHLNLGETDEVLNLYDGPIYGEPTAFGFDMADAAALLWRLRLQDVDVGDRWRVLADRFVGQPAGANAFVDTHAMMAFVGAGRDADALALLATQKAVLGSSTDNAMFVREVGLAACEAIHAFGAGDASRAADRLRTVRNRSSRFGGSHAQRDVLDLTLIAAATASGQTALAQALLAEREAAHPLSPADRALAA
ncbi:MAG: tetratricopeptide repeat protein [Phenylobacterium sp.]|nr:tetratricopeptide repeat protein [Phenylobacterium sp.]